MTVTKKDCTIKIKLDNGEDITYHSDKELDAFLYERRASFEEIFDSVEIDKTFSISADPVIETSARLRESEKPTLQAVYAHAEKTKKAIDAREMAAIGTTTMYKHVGNTDKWTLPLTDYSGLNRKKKEELKAKGKNETEIQYILEEQQKRYQKYGTDFHTMMEAAFGKNKDGDIVESLPNDKIGGMEIIINAALKGQTYEVAKTIAGKIKARHPKAVKIFTEKEIYSKYIDGEFLRVINSIKGVSHANGKPYSSIVGKPDLLVLNEDGSVDLYDWKTSHGSIGNSWAESTWSQSKKDEVEAQLVTYKAILAQHGIKVNSINIVSIVGELDPNIDATYTGFKFDNIISIPSGSKIDQTTKLRFKTLVNFDTDKIAKLNKLFNDTYPGTNEFLKTSLLDRDIESFKNSDQTKKVTDEKGITKWIIYKDAIAGGGKIVCNSEEEFNQKLKDYLQILNGLRKTEMSDAGETLFELCQTRNLDGLYDWANQVSRGNALENIANFKKYVSQGWTLVNQPELFSNGIFVFQLGQRSEIVMLGIGDLHVIYTGLDKGKTVLGSKVDDTSFGNDSSYVLNSNRGHLLEMKALMFVVQNQELFKNCPIGRIRTLTLHNKTRVSDSNSRLQENYRRLWARYQNDPEIKLPYLPEGLFMDDALACVKCAEDIIYSAEGLSIKNPNMFDDIASQYTVDNLEEILNLIHQLERSYPKLKNQSESFASDDPVYLAYSELLKAYQHAHIGFDAEITSEKPQGEVFNENINPDGTYAVSFEISNSENLRRFDRVRNIFSRKINLEYEKDYARKWQHLMEKVTKEVEEIDGINTKLGGEWRFFRDWFVLDEKTGEPTEDFRLKDPDTDTYFNKRPAAKEACKFFLEMINKGRTQKQIDNGEYYNVPLVRGDFWEQIANNDLTTAVKEQIENWWNPIREGLMGAPDESTFKIKEERGLELWNPFLSWELTKRKEFITKKTVKYFSTNLDNIFLTTMAWQTKVNACKRFLPSLQAFRVLMRIENQNNGAKMQEVENALNAYMDRVIFNQNIMKESWRRTYGLLAALKSVTSKIALSFKISQLAREGGTSSISIAVNKAFGSGHGALLHDFDEASYIAALEEMGAMTLESGNILSKVQQINAMFGISDFGFSKMAESSKSYRFAPLNLDESIAYWTSSAPDFFHRNAMLVMKLKSIGAWGAYLENEDGDVYYDWTKDEQYKVYQKYSKYSDVPTDLRSKWREQKDKYLDAIEEWKTLGDDYANLKEGDPLPQALKPSELGNLKTQADVLFGNYDEETKSVMMHTFFGSLFMQFKIYGYAQLLRYVKTPGAINVIIKEPKKEINPTTGKLEKVAIVVNEDGTDATFKFESEVTDEEWNSNRAKIYRETNGAYMEGKFQSIFQMFKAIKNMSLTDFKTILSDPVKKYNLLMILWDSLFAMLFSALIAVLFGEDTIDNMSDEDWFTQWSYGVATGIAQDGPIWQVAKGLYSDGTLPVLSSLKRYVSTAESVLSGNTNPISAVLNTFGATRELASYFDE